MDALLQKTIEGSTDGPHLLITGGVHGDEFEPMTAIRRLIKVWPRDHLCGRITLIPVVNQPAFQRGTRIAEDGLDLARTCPGKPVGSITEELARHLCRQIRAADYYIDLHTGGTALELLPLVGYMLHPESKVLDQQRRMARAFNLPIIWGTSAELEGRSLSIARDAGVPAIYAEYGGAAVCDRRGVEAYVNGCLNVAAALGMIRQRRPSPCVEYLVEDRRRQSGHLQIQHPAPCDGFFESVVSLGEIVAAGQPLGHVVDPLGENPRQVSAAEAGLVLMLRSFPRVRRGDSLAAMLPATAPGKVQLG